MIDFASESLLSLGDAAKILPGRPHIATLHRWRLRGVRSTRLETVLVGGKRFTSREALCRFVEAVSRETSPASPPKSDAFGTRKCEIDRSEGQLERELGIKLSKSPPDLPDTG